MDDLNRLLARFDIETAATLAAVASCPDAILDRRPEVRPDSADSADSGSPGPESRVPAIRTIREQAEHLDLIRRSTAIAILGEDERYAELPRSADRSDGSDGRAPDRPPTRTPDRASWLERLREGLRQVGAPLVDAGRRTGGSLPSSPRRDEYRMPRPGES